MSDHRHAIARKRVVYDMPGMERVRMAADLPYRTRDGAARTMDVYYPEAFAGVERLPAVLFVTGLSDVGAQALLGCRISKMDAFVSWATLVAAAGLIGVTYTTGADPEMDTRDVLEHLHAHGEALGIDGGRIAMWACSSHVPNALEQLIHAPRRVARAVLCYGFMLDLDGDTGVADAQRAWKFVNPAGGRNVSDLPPDVPLFIARAGGDATSGVNASIDRFVAHALRHNLPLTVVNHRTGPHAFDLDDESEATRQVIDQILAFLRQT